MVSCIEVTYYQVKSLLLTWLARGVNMESGENIYLRLAFRGVCISSNASVSTVPANVRIHHFM